MEMIILLRREQISSILVVYGVFTMEVTKPRLIQECILVGYVPPALYRTGGGLCPGGGLCMVSFLSPLDRDPPEQNDLTHACENITLPQTSFAGR